MVPLVQHGATDDGWELCTRHGGRPASAVGPLTVAQVASLAAGVASTLADLHDLGIVHGRLDASHVLVGDHGRPVLCGFGDGEPPARPADDVAALGALLDRWLGTDDAGEPIPERRWWGRRRVGRLGSSRPPPARRPSGRRPAHLPPDGASTGGRHRRCRAGRGLARRTSGDRRAGGPAHLDPIERLRATAPFEIPVAWAGARKVLVVGVASGPAGRRRCRRDSSPSGDRPAPPPRPRRPAPPKRPPPEVRTAAPRRERGARRPVAVATGSGQAGDEVLIDDWDCDGDATPALLRPGTGEVFVFPRWIDEGTLAVEPEASRSRAPDALLSEIAEGACPTLAVRTVAGEVRARAEAVR